MITFEKYNMTLDVDVEKTKAYYQNRPQLENIEIKNFEKQAKEAAPLLNDFLTELGVDITKPDELCYCWKDEKGILHYNVAYTVTGRIIRAIQYEAILQDKSALHLVLETEYVPNKQTEPYFAFTIYNIEMPWILEEAFPEMKKVENTARESFLKKMIKKLKKY